MCAIRAGLGEPEPGLQGQSCPQCPVDRDGDGWLPCEQICATGSLPALPAPAAVADGWQVPAPVPAFRAAAVGRFCTLGVPAVAMEMPASCPNGKSCLWPWIRDSGQTPGKGQQATAARQAMLLLRSTSASAVVPPATAGQGGMASPGVTGSVSRHRPAPAGHPVGGGAGRGAGPRHAGVPGAGGARLPALRLAAPRPGLPRLAALHPLRPLPRGVLHHRHAAGAPRPRQGKRGRRARRGHGPAPQVRARPSRRGTSTSSR